MRVIVDLEEGMSRQEAQAWVLAIADKFGSQLVEEVLKQREARIERGPVNTEQSRSRCIECGEYNCDHEGVGHYRG